MKIRSFETQNNIFLAPMAGITDIPFRILCKEQGCGMVFTEMTSAKGLVHRDRKSFDLAAVRDGERPAAVQIFGSDPGVMGEAASILNESNCDALDINMGCPTPKITKSGDGSSLMRNPELVGRIIRAVVDASVKPVMVKIRKGWNADSVNAVRIAQIAEANGAAAVTVHGRTRDQFYSGKSDLEIIRLVKESVAVPVIGNGDIYTREDADRMFAYTRCDAVLIGRGAQGNPWVFAELTGAYANGLERPNSEEKRRLVLRHYEMLIALRGERVATLEMRKHAAWYTRGIPNSAAARERIFTAGSYDEMAAIINELF